MAEAISGEETAEAEILVGGTLAAEIAVEAGAAETSGEGISGEETEEAEAAAAVDSPGDEFGLNHKSLEKSSPLTACFDF